MAKLKSKRGPSGPRRSLSKEAQRRKEGAAENLKKPTFTPSRVALIGFLVSMGVGLALNISENQPDRETGNPEKISTLSPLDLQEAEVDKLIIEVERGMAAFMNIIRQKLKTAEIHPGFRASIELMFGFFEENYVNANKNAVRISRNGGEAAVNLTQFVYDLLIRPSREHGSSGESLVVASYVPIPAKTMRLAPGFDGNNIVHLIAVIHEYAHVLDDVAAYHMGHDGSDVDRSEMHKNGGIPLDWEVKAFSYSVELLNLYLDGLLLDSARKGVDFKSDYMKEELRKRLNFPDVVDRGTFLGSAHLLQLADVYYSNGGTPMEQSVPKEFIEEIRRSYALSHDSELYVLWGPPPKYVKVNDYVLSKFQGEKF